MVSDADILMTAHGLLKIHGEKAAMECAQVADRWAKRGDAEASGVWTRILAAIREIQRGRGLSAILKSTRFRKGYPLLVRIGHDGSASRQKDMTPRGINYLPSINRVLPAAVMRRLPNKL